MAGQIVHVEFLAEDVDRAQRFWSGLFGWNFGDSGMPGMDYRMAQTGEQSGAAIYASDSRGHPKYYFDTDDIDASSAKVRELGGTADGEGARPDPRVVRCLHRQRGQRVPPVAGGRVCALVGGRGGGRHRRHRHGCGRHGHGGGGHRDGRRCRRRRAVGVGARPARAVAVRVAVRPVAMVATLRGRGRSGDGRRRRRQSAAVHLRPPLIPGAMVVVSAPLMIVAARARVGARAGRSGAGVRGVAPVAMPARLRGAHPEAAAEIEDEVAETLADGEKLATGGLEIEALSTRARHRPPRLPGQRQRRLHRRRPLQGNGRRHDGARRQRLRRPARPR